MKKIILTIFMLFIGSVGVIALENVPTLEILGYDDTSVTLKVITDSVDEDSICYVYRSVDGILYDNSIMIDCNKIYVDDELGSEKTYYYKASIGNNDNYSEVLSVTTEKIDNNLKDVSETKKSNHVISFVMFMTLVVFFIVLLVSMLFFKKKLIK